MADLEAKARQLHVAKVGEADALRKCARLPSPFAPFSMHRS